MRFSSSFSAIALAVALMTQAAPTFAAQPNPADFSIVGFHPGLTVEQARKALTDYDHGSLLLSDFLADKADGSGTYLKAIVGQNKERTETIGIVFTQFVGGGGKAYEVIRNRTYPEGGRPLITTVKDAVASNYGIDLKYVNSWDKGNWLALGTYDPSGKPTSHKGCLNTANGGQGVNPVLGNFGLPLWVEVNSNCGVALSAEVLPWRAQGSSDTVNEMRQHLIDSQMEVEDIQTAIQTHDAAQKAENEKRLQDAAKVKPNL
jgi:hypothetical protein